MRAFVAVLLQPEIVGKIVGVQDHLKEMGARGHFTAPDNLHLTLAFLGQTDRLEDAVKAMQGAVGTAFTLTMEHGGHFAKRGGDVLWMGVQHNAELAALQSRLCERLRAAGFILEDRPYVPHITLGRRMTLPPGMEWEALDWPVLSQPVREIHLMESTRVDGRLCYLSRACVSLAEHSCNS